MKAVKILTAQALPGMMVAKDILANDNQLIIARDTRLTDKIITRLEFYSIPDLLILSDGNIGNQENSFPESTYYETIRNSEAFQLFHMAYANTLSEFKNTLDSIISIEEGLNTDALMADVSRILFQSNTNIELFNMLHCIRNYDDTTYIHSLNVALICNIIGKWLHFTPNDLEAITLAGLLHDLGKLLIPADIMGKPSKLTEEEFSLVKTHTLQGYNILKRKKIDSRIKEAALMHHERCDGSGYPQGLKADQIDPFAKLVAIADVYDAMTCARVYRGPLCPFEVISLFETEGYTKYDPKFIMTFLEGIVQTYINNNVRLNDKREGEIVLINRFELSRPVVKIGDQYVDLSRERKLSIEALI